MDALEVERSIKLGDGLRGVYASLTYAVTRRDPQLPADQIEDCRELKSFIEEHPDRVRVNRRGFIIIKPLGMVIPEHRDAIA